MTRDGRRGKSACSGQEPYRIYLPGPYFIYEHRSSSTSLAVSPEGGVVQQAPDSAFGFERGLHQDLEKEMFRDEKRGSERAFGTEETQRTSRLRRVCKLLEPSRGATAHHRLPAG
jgi:hypothetical protein